MGGPIRRRHKIVVDITFNDPIPEKEAIRRVDRVIADGLSRWQDGKGYVTVYSVKNFLRTVKGMLSAGRINIPANTPEKAYPEGIVLWRRK